MYHVKLSIASDNAGCNRQLPGRGFVWGNYHFHINEDVAEADFWVVYSKGQRKTETCTNQKIWEVLHTSDYTTQKLPSL